MLLDIVSLSGDIGRDAPPSAETDTGSLAFAGVGLFGTGNADFEADAFELRGEIFGQGGRDGVAGALGLAAAAEDLV